MLERLARACALHKWIVIGVWVGLLVLLNGVAGSIGADWRTDFTLPDGEAKEVQELLAANNPERAGFNGTIVVASDSTIDDPAVEERLNELIAIADEFDGVDVTSPYDAPNQVSADRTIAFAELSISDRGFEDLVDFGEALKESVAELDDNDPIAGLQVELGGDPFGEFELPESEVYGVLAAMIILIVAFGSVMAMGLPIGIALFGLGCATAIVSLFSHVMAIPDFTTAMVAMIGLGVGIDYALFIVTRYREATHAGLSTEDAIAEAIDTSGRAVLFAGVTVIIALLGLTLMGLAFVSGIAIAAAIGVLTMVVGSLTLLPALLYWVGPRIEQTTRVAVIAVALLVIGIFVGVAFGQGPVALAAVVLAIALVAASFFVGRDTLRAQIPKRAEKPRERSFWYRWSRFIQRRPWQSLAAGLIALVVIAAPVFSMRLGFGDFGNYPESQTVRRAYDLLAEGFGPGTNGPIFITVEGDIATDPDAVQAFADGLQAADAGLSAADEAPDAPPVSDATSGTEAAAPAPADSEAPAPAETGDGPHRIAFTVVPPAPSDDLAMVIVYPTAAPQDAATAELVQWLRNDAIPESGVDAMVGGAVAAAADFSSYMGGRMPLLIGVVLALSFILLMVVFRSILVPLKAVVMNLLSVGAAYGLLVAVFQWGWLSELVGVDRAGPIEAWIPMFLFAIVFGLSMDYEVFLLSRMKEEYDKTVRRGHPDNANAVADGLAITARVITAAAIIMFCVFAAFVLGDERSLKMFGFGLAVAVLIDATVVRMVLVPATMELLGDRNWWLPGSLDRILPTIHVEGKHREAAVESPADGVDHGEA